MKKIAIIGAGGFLGRHLVELLTSQGKEVAGVSLEPPPIGIKCSDWLTCDLTQDTSGLGDFLSRFRPDALLHLAATSFEPTAASQPWNVLKNNLLSMLNVLTACRCLLGETVCVIISSSAVYGRNVQDDSPLTETHPLNPLTIYGVSKLAVEALALQHWRAYGMRVIIVRPFNLTGPGEHASFVTSAFARQIALIEKGKQHGVVKVGNLRTARDFTDVRDAVRAIVAISEVGQPGEVYNLCSGVGVTIADLVRKLLKETPSAIDIQPDPILIRGVEIQSQRGDSTKLRKCTGWQPYNTLDQTLADVLDDWRARI